MRRSTIGTPFVPYALVLLGLGLVLHGLGCQPAAVTAGPGSRAFMVPGPGAARYQAALSPPTLQEDADKRVYAFDVALESYGTWNGTVELQRPSGEGTITLKQGSVQIRVVTQLTDEGVQLDYRFDDGKTRSRTVAVLPRDFYADKGAQAEWLKRGVLPEAGLPPLHPVHELAQAVIAELGDRDLEPMEASIGRSVQEIVMTIDAPALVGDKLIPSFAATAAADSCEDAVAPPKKQERQLVKANVSIDAGKLFAGAPKLSADAYGIWNRLQSNCPKGAAPGMTNRTDATAYLTFDAMPGDLCKNGLILYMKGSSVSVLDNQIPGRANGCAEETLATRPPDVTELIAFDIKVGDAASTHWSADDGNGDTGCNQPRCGGIFGEAYTCITLRKDGAIYLPVFKVKSGMTFTTSTDRDECTKMLGKVNP